MVLMSTTDITFIFWCIIIIIRFGCSVPNIPKLDNTRLPGCGFLNITPCGIQDCVINCFTHSGCTSINYVRRDLLCELNFDTARDGMLEASDISSYVNITNVKGINSPCTATDCQISQSCIVLKTGTFKCMQFTIQTAETTTAFPTTTDSVTSTSLTTTTTTTTTTAVATTTTTTASTTKATTTTTAISTTMIPSTITSIVVSSQCVPPYIYDATLRQCVRDLDGCPTESDANTACTEHGANPDGNSNENRGTYLGCYKVDSDLQQRKTHEENSNQLTLEKCRNTCCGRSSRYYGTKNRKICYCMNADPSTFLKLKSDWSCYKRCQGDHNQKCGGSSEISAYTTGYRCIKNPG